MMGEIFSDKELDELDNRFKRAMDDKFDAYNETINGQAKRIEELEAENEKLRDRCKHDAVILIGNTAHYVSDAVRQEFARLRALVRLRSGRT